MEASNTLRTKACYKASCPILQQSNFSLDAGKVKFLRYVFFEIKFAGLNLFIKV